jgi:hypothetical protein
MNAKGGDLYLRPLDGPELLLVDGLNAEAVKDMHRQGLAPAVTVETCPGRFQAWVKLSVDPLPEKLRAHAVAGLACVLANVGQDGQLGRLAGFTNQQVATNRAGRQPFVLAAGATGAVAPAAEPYLAAIEQNLQKLAAEKQSLIDAEKAREAPRHSRGRSR